MNTMKLNYKELYEAGDMNRLFEKVQKHTRIKIGITKFAGMETEDVIQEASLKVYCSLRHYDEEKGQISTFIDRVIENAIKDCYKKCGSIKNLIVVNSDTIAENYEVSEDSETPSQFGKEDFGFENAEFIYDLMNNIGLSDREKTVFKLYTKGYGFVEIAKIIGVTKSRMSQIWSGIKDKYNKS